MKIKVCNRSLSRALALIALVPLLSGCGTSAGKTYDEDSPSEAAASAAPEVLSSFSVAAESQVSSVPAGETDCAVLFVNVGKADAAILRFGETIVLIDTGSAESLPQLIAGLNAMNVTKIDAVFLTHSHSDHIGGLDGLAANYPIGTVYSSVYGEENKDGETKIVALAEKLGLEHKELGAGDRVSFASGVSLLALGPLTYNEDDENDNSLVLRFTCRGTSFLFTGDMQFAEEQTLISAGAALKSDVLKVGNHGNPDATGDDFAAAVSPKIAVISTDTSVDTDSANPRVVSALGGASVYTTQDCPIGVLISWNAAGEPVVSSPAAEESYPALTISDIHKKRQTVTLVNDGTAAIDLSGCVLFSSRTDAALRFPDGTTLAAGETLTVGSDQAIPFPGEDKPLSTKKSNTLSLYGRYGTLIDSFTD